jgi:catechol 2,3-dioxygenase-like lactoylglutathione lyase family enzyme
MSMQVLFAGVAVRDFPVALDWYRRLFDREPDVVAHDREVLWRVSETAWLYVVEDQERAGRGLVAMLVSDLDEAVAELEHRGIHTDRVEQQGDAGRKATVLDPDGNSVGLIQVA